MQKTPLIQRGAKRPTPLYLYLRQLQVAVNLIKALLQKSSGKLQVHLRFKQYLVLLGCLFCLGLMLPIVAQPNSFATDPEDLLPQPQVHPLPLLLAQWQDNEQSGDYAGDYFEQVQPSRFGYLIWSKLPVQIYVDLPTTQAESAQAQREKDWYQAVLAAIEDWQPYFPLEVTSQNENADVHILRSRPPLQLQTDGNLGRARSAETHYQISIGYDGDQAFLSHHFTILLDDRQARHYLQATARHELGHALGIWGHSPNLNDAMYFAQTHEPAAISTRDLNTLKQIYQQPTRLGWPISVQVSRSLIGRSLVHRSLTYRSFKQAQTFSLDF